MKPYFVLVLMSSVSKLLQTGKKIPDISPLESSRWKAFVEDDKTKSYSYYLPNNDYQEEVQKNMKAVDKVTYTQQSKTFAKDQLDRWFRELHPTSLDNGDKVVDDKEERNNHSSCFWTDSHYKGEQLLRKTAWVVLDNECQCEYGYSDTWQPIANKNNNAINDIISEITNAVSEVTGCNGLFNCCNLNYYPRGGGVGFHADDEFLFDGLNRETCIVSLSLCSTSTSTKEGEEDNKDSCNNWGARKFLIKPKEYSQQNEDDVQEDYSGSDDNICSNSYSNSNVQEVILNHGDLLTMEGMFQKHYFHSVWPGDSKKFLDHPLTQGERINLTWRTIVKHLDGSDECRGIICPLSSSNK